MDAKQAKANGAVPIGKILGTVLKTCRPESADALQHVWSLWDRVVGKTISENARPAAVNGKILLVHVNSSPWIHQLHFEKKSLIKHLNDAFGKELIDDIKFKIGPMP